MDEPTYRKVSNKYLDERIVYGANSYWYFQVSNLDVQ